jgi:hypothetical protein
MPHTSETRRAGGAAGLEDRISLAANPSKISPNRPGPQAAFALNFRLYRKNSLLAFFDLKMSSGLILRGCQLHESHGKRWVGVPARSYEAADGTQSWARIVDFRDRRASVRFQEMATAAAVAAYERIRGAA